MSTLTDERVACWYPRLFRTALRLTGSADLAADLTQETFCKAVKNWDQFDGRSLPTTWLHRILVNCARDWWRRKSAMPVESLDEWSSSHGDGKVSSLSANTENEGLHERAVRVRRAIDELPVALRPAFVATVIDGYTYQEAAEMLAVPVGTIGSRVFEARKLLRSAMRQEFEE